MRGFTQTAVDNFRAKKKTRIEWDGVVPGFGVRITANGVKSYVLAYRIDGRQTKFVIGPADGPENLDLAVAREKALNLREGVKKGIDPHASQREERERQRIERERLAAEPTVADLKQAFYEKHVLVENGEDQQRAVRGLLGVGKKPSNTKAGAVRMPKEWDQLKADAVTYVMVTDLHKSMRKKPYRANRLLSAIRAMFNWGMGPERGLCSKNPARGVKKFPEDPRAVWMPEEQLKAIDAAITEYGAESAERVLGTEAAAMNAALAGELVRLLMLTGYRRREWMRAKKESFDMAHATWTKPSHAVKSRKPVTVRLSPAVMVVLRRVMASTPASEPFLFPGKPTKGSESAGRPRTTIRRVWEQILRKVGLADEYTVVGKSGKPLKRYTLKIRIHDLRHSYCSWLAERGIPLLVIGESVGHLDPATTRRYAHIAEKSAQNAQDMFGKMVTQRVQ